MYKQKPNMTLHMREDKFAANEYWKSEYSFRIKE